MVLEKLTGNPNTLSIWMIIARGKGGVHQWTIRTSVTATAFPGRISVIKEKLHRPVQGKGLREGWEWGLFVIKRKSNACIMFGHAAPPIRKFEIATFAN
jgi:hypothetical protein